MTLDDWKTSSDSDGNSIKTRKQIENVELDEDFWDILATTHPSIMYAAAIRTDESSAKAIVQKLDQAYENDIGGHNVSEELKAEIKQIREEIVEDRQL